MNFKDKLTLLKERMIQWISAYKKLVVPISIGVIIFLVLIINMNFFQITYFKMKDMPDKVVNILTKTPNKDYDNLYFKYGLNYLIEDGSEVSLAFLEKCFKELDITMQDKIVEMYNEEKLTFQNQEGIFDRVVDEQVSDSIKTYMKNMDNTIFERSLSDYFETSSKLTQDSVDALYKLLSIKGSKIPLENFKLSIFELLSFPHNGDEESNSIKILDFIKPESVKTTLINELKIKEIDIQNLSVWIDILNKKRIITPQEYLGFTNAYGMIKKSQESLKQIQLQEVDLLNMKQAVDVETDVLQGQITKINKDIEGLNEQIGTYRNRVSSLKNYKQVELYILDRYENGEYEAAIPEKSWLFGTYKPGSKKVRLKTTRTTITDMGVQTFDVYDCGKLDSGEVSYIEVSTEQLESIKEIDNKIEEAEASIKLKQGEIDKLTKEIAQIRKENNYESTLNLIEELAAKKENISLEIEKNRLAIQNLLGIGKIIV